MSTSLQDLVPERFRTKTLWELLAYFREEGEWHNVERAVMDRLYDLKVDDIQIETLVADLRAHGVALAALAQAPRITGFGRQERGGGGWWVEVTAPTWQSSHIAPTLEQALSGALTYIKDHS